MFKLVHFFELYKLKTVKKREIYLKLQLNTKTKKNNNVLRYYIRKIKILYLKRNNDKTQKNKHCDS